MKNQAYKLIDLVSFTNKMENLGFKVQYMPNRGVYGFRKGKR